MAATYLGFSVVMLGGLRKLGVPVTGREARAINNLRNHTTQNVYGDGIDLGTSRRTEDALAELCHENGATWVDYYDSHIHCDWSAAALDPAFFDVGVEGLGW